MRLILLVSFPNEVKAFKKYLYKLFRRAQYYRSGGGYNNEVYPNTFLLGDCFSLFFEYLNINNYRAFVIWPNTIKDKETLGKLYMQFYSEMIKLNLELREKFQPVEFGYLIKKKKLIAKGMNKEEYLTIAKNAAQAALNVMPDTLHFEKIQRTFYEYKLDDISRPVVQFIMKIQDSIYDSQATQSERDSMREFKESCAENEKIELQRQEELEKLAKKLKTLKRERRKNLNNPQPYCNYDYGYVSKRYDPVTGKTRLSFIPPDVDRPLKDKILASPS
jgi:hypothetical protein